MTPKEAYKVLEMFLHKQCDLTRTLPLYSDNEVWSAVNIASDALEKQIPQKIDNKDADDLVSGCHCCGEINALWKPNGSRNNYCGNCGQAIDWSDTEC